MKIRKARRIKSQVTKLADQGQLDLFVRVPGKDDSEDYVNWLRNAASKSNRY